MVAAGFNSVYDLYLKSKGIDEFYLEMNKSYNFNVNPPVLNKNQDPIYLTVPINFGKWFLAMMNFVSISLLVTLEMVKFAQGMYIEWDWMIFDEEKNISAKA